MKISTVLVAIFLVIVPTVVISLWVVGLGINALLPTIPFWGKFLVGLLVFAPTAGIVCIPFYALVLGAYAASFWFQARKEVAAMKKEIADKY